METIYTKNVQNYLIQCGLPLQDDEIIREIPNTNQRYYISNYGNVISLCKKSPHILKPQPWGNGYFCVTINGKKQRIHRLVAQAFLENPQEKPVVHHRDNDKHNNHLDNLAFATHKENTQEYLKYKREQIVE